jgi:hypothetical protein
MSVKISWSDTVTDNKIWSEKIISQLHLPTINLKGLAGMEIAAVWLDFGNEPPETSLGLDAEIHLMYA